MSRRRARRLAARASALRARAHAVLRHPLRLLVAALLLLGACKLMPNAPIVNPAPEPVFPQDFDVVDLTRPLDKSAPFIPHAEAFPFERMEFKAPRTQGWRTGAYSGLEHMGTHLAAPLSRLPVGASAEKIPASQLVLPLVVVDLPAAAKEGGVLTLTALQADERAKGAIPAGAIVVLRTGRGEMQASDPALLGAKNGAYSFPGWSDEAVRWLSVERRVRAIGTDAPAIDAGINLVAAPAQSAGSVAGLFFVVGLADLSRVPVRGATLVVGAAPMVGAAGAPARVLALVPTK